MMLLTAANSLVRDRPSFLALRRFTYRLNAAVTAAMLIGILPPVFRFVTITLMGLPPESGAPGSRRHGDPRAMAGGHRIPALLPGHSRPPRPRSPVAYGTVLRLASMSATAAVLALTSPLHGASIGATPSPPACWWRRWPAA